MARSLFNLPSLGVRAPPRRPDQPSIRIVGIAARPRSRWPWIFRYIVYHLAAAFGIVVAFVVWLLLKVLL